VTFDRPMPANVGMSERFTNTPDRFLVFANSGLAAVENDAVVEGAGVERWDTVAGNSEPVPSSPAGAGRVKFHVKLAPAGSDVLLIRTAPVALSSWREEPQWKPLEAGNWTIQADSPNVLVLDYCDLTIGGETERNINTWRANWTAWQRHGFERPAWDNAVQFRNRVYDRNHFLADSGFDATFRFTVVDAEALRGLELAVETPELYKVTVNGKAIAWSSATRWMDPHLMSAAVEAAARVGENVVTISAHPFDVRMELENIYLRGRFTVEPASEGFVLRKSRALQLGSWRDQGLRFYGDSVLYETNVRLPDGAGQIAVQLPKWEGTVAEVLLDGKRAGLIAWQPLELKMAAAPGAHRIGVRVVATPRNVFGPFHNPAKLRMRAWPAAWREFPEHQPAGASYDLLDYGLMEPPRILVADRTLK